MGSLKVLIRNQYYYVSKPYLLSPPINKLLHSSNACGQQKASPKPKDISQPHTQAVTNKCKKSSRVVTNKPVVGILGGGISGLSAAYYLTKNFVDNVQPVVFEKTSRVGGWMRTVTTNGGTRYEIGPRTIRPAGISGLNTLDLIEELGLDRDVMFIKRDHPTAQNRYIYLDGKLVKLPADAASLFKKMEPFSKPLIFNGIRDLLAPRKRLPDDSIYGFVARRFGNQVADYLIDPMIRGITGGDSKKISVKFLLKDLFELEQQYGSVIIGQLLKKFSNKNDKLCKLTPEEKRIGFSKIAASSLQGNWAVWSLEQGLGYLPAKLEEYLVSQKVEIRTNTTVKSIKFDKDNINVNFYTHDDQNRTDLISCDHLISTVPGMYFSDILRNSEGLGSQQNSELTDLIGSIKGADLQVTGLTYDHDILEENAFGFLVPQVEKSVDGLLGVVFDSCSFPQEDNKTVITVMSRNSNAEIESIDKIKWYVEQTLGVKSQPIEYRTEMLRNCIPQYAVGHYEKVERVKEIMKDSGIPVTVAGATWDGVSVNDCIYSGKKAAAHVGELLQTKIVSKKKMSA